MRRLAALMVLALAFGGPARGAPAVDLALVLAVDASRSVDVEEFELQRSGYVTAFRDPRVLAAITGGPLGAVAITYFQWSGPRVHHVSIPWTVLRGRADVDAFAAAMAGAERTIFGGGTSLSGAIDYGVYLLGRLPVEATRRVIDVSGDGSNNNGRLPPYARDEAVAQGITINGLAILNDEPLLDLYYHSHVIGGPGSFVIATEDYDTFSRAILTKLIREIAYVPEPSDERSNSSTWRAASSSEMP